MQLLNWFRAYSTNWHVAVKYDIKHTMHGMGMHDISVHDLGVHDVACMMWAYVTWHGMAWASINREIFPAVNILCPF